MSTHDNTFIDAYGLELNDELEATHVEPTRLEAGAVNKPTPIENTQPSERAYRFDSATRRQTLRGPHFNMERVASKASEETSGWDTMDMNVIDVGAAWVPSPVIAQPSFAEEPVEARQSHVVEPGGAVDVAVVEETIETQEEVVDAVTPVVAQPEVTAVDAEELAPQQEPTNAEIEAPAVTESVPSIESAERFSPVWEVDRFQWPDEIEELFRSQTEYFDYAGKKLVAASREGLNILAITSTRSGEGSTTLALCLARAAAGAGAKVGLLDGSLVRSELGEKLGVDFASGWQSAATSEQPLAEAAITGLEEGITLFPSAAGPETDIESLGDERVGHVFRAAAANYDLLIIDTGQADLGTNVETLDAAIVVRDIRHTSEAETLTVAAALRNCGVKAVGIAENFGNSHATRAAA